MRTTFAWQRLGRKCGGDEFAFHNYRGMVRRRRWQWPS